MIRASKRGGRKGVTPRQFGEVTLHALLRTTASDSNVSCHGKHWMIFTRSIARAALISYCKRRALSSAKSSQYDGHTLVSCSSGKNRIVSPIRDGCDERGMTIADA